MQGTFTEEKVVLTDEIAAIENAIAERLGRQRYKIWFEDTTNFKCSNGYLKIGIPNLFVGNWIKKNFLNDIQACVKDVAGSEAIVSFHIDSQLSDAYVKKQVRQKSTTLTSKKTQNGNSGGRIVRQKQLRLELDNFIVGSGNQLAYNTAMSIVDSEKSPFNPLFIHGGYGLGKTHLLQGICNAVCKRRPGTGWLYLSAEEFTNQFVLALKTRKLEAFRRRFRQKDLLAIDDIHFLASKPSTQEEFLHTFNSIDLAGKQIVLASDAHPKMIKQLSEKLVNRFVSGMVVKIDKPDFKTRCSICRQRASVMDRKLDSEVIEYLASKVSTSIRELEGALYKLVAYSSLEKRDVTLGMARQVLSEHMTSVEPVIHLSNIESAVCKFFEVKVADLHSTKKLKTVVFARSFFVYLVRKHKKMSFPEIGKVLGGKNHSTVLMACRRLEDMLTRNCDVNWQGSAGNRIAKCRDIFEKLEIMIKD